MLLVAAVGGVILGSHTEAPAPGRRAPRRGAAGGGAGLVTGPGVAWYLGVAAFLFGTGALGVLIRRNILIVLLSLEIMLNGANLALIAFSRQAGNGAGQIFALAVMAVAAVGGLRRPRPGRGPAPAAARDRRRHALGAARMTGGGWLCLLAPLAGTILILLGGTRISRPDGRLDLDRERLRRVRRRRLGVPLAPLAGRPRGLASRPRGRGSRAAASGSGCRCSSTRSAP